MRDRDGNNCAVLGEDASAATHVERKTPLQCKREELKDPQYQEGAIGKPREKQASGKRDDKETRPL